MASYRVMSWRGIPSQVKATDDTGATVSEMLPPFFMQEIDRVAMAEGLIDSDEYLESWVWSEESTREGPAEEVARAVVEEVAQAWREENERSEPSRSPRGSTCRTRGRRGDAPRRTRPRR